MVQSVWLYMAKIFCTMGLRCTSWTASSISRILADDEISSDTFAARSRSMMSERPLVCAPLFMVLPCRSLWARSPVMIVLLSIPLRVRNIFICSGVQFCISSAMMKALSKVRPRMNPSGDISIFPLDII